MSYKSKMRPPKRKGVSLRKEHKSEKGGLTKKGRDYYNRKTGSNLKAPQTGGVQGKEVSVQECQE